MLQRCHCSQCDKEIDRLLIRQKMLCDDCKRSKQRERYRRDPSKQRQAQERWAAKYPERALQSSRKSAMKYKWANIEKVRKRASITDAKRYVENRDRRYTISRRAEQQRRRSKLYRLYLNVLQCMARSIQSASYRGAGWPLLDYSPAQFRAHIETHFEAGMDWTNYGHDEGKWEVGHIRPIASYDPATNIPETVIKEAFALDNLKPMWSRKNAQQSSVWNGQYWTRHSH